VAQTPPEIRDGSRGPDKGIDDRQRRQLITVGLLVAVAIVVLAFILENRDPVKISFIVFDAETSLIWLIIMSLVAGALMSHLLGRVLRRRFGRKPTSE
jgi:uncharacterized integral membrane protein